MRIKPCTEDEEHEDSDEDIQTEKAHLHDFVGDVVHVEEKMPTGVIYFLILITKLITQKRLRL